MGAIIKLPPGIPRSLPIGYLLLRMSIASWATMYGYAVAHTECDEDRVTNELALQQGDRLFSVYKKEGVRTIWIITEWDRSVTTALFQMNIKHATDSDRSSMKSLLSVEVASRCISQYSTDSKTYNVHAYIHTFQF